VLRGIVFVMHLANTGTGGSQMPIVSCVDWLRPWRWKHRLRSHPSLLSRYVVM